MLSGGLAGKPTFPAHRQMQRLPAVSCSFCSHPVPSASELERQPNRRHPGYAHHAPQTGLTPSTRGAGVGSTLVNHQRANPPLAPGTHSPTALQHRAPLPQGATVGGGGNGASQADGTGDTREGSGPKAPERHPPRITPVSSGAEGPCEGMQNQQQLPGLQSGSCSLHPGAQPGDKSAGRWGPHRCASLPWPAPSSSVGLAEGARGSMARESPPFPPALALDSGLPPPRRQCNTLICFAAGSLILQI